ncbi:MAG: tetratricopeptide repeat protein [Prevotellaceae bacterium]|jgi:tetratricopeptide (TPR) repeat protein|nr:tetratricopeptide repeat protein [Prevotellaceae bacterium]
MRIVYLFIAFVCLSVCNLQAQTLEQAKNFYQKGQYEKAKPTFRRFVKSQPGNGNYNLWYGVCCLQTGQAEAAVGYLETAVKKRITGGQYYLAQAYEQTYRFEEAVTCLEAYIAELVKRKRSTDQAEKLLEKSKNGLRMLRGVEEVCIIDSVVVDKNRFLDAYRISRESGSLFMYNDFFQQKKEDEATVYETELGNRIYYGEQGETDGKFNVYTCNKMQGEWGKGRPLPSLINDSVNANYPYVMTDGITIYYASDGPQSMGGYDIFVTRYNMNNDSYLAPDNVGMPFNSPANDYMYVIDEYHELGWFASDRFQPEGKVCVYIFVPNVSKRVYDYETTDNKKLRRLALIQSIQETWEDASIVNEARLRLQEVRTAKAPVKRTYDFEFVIDDAHTYYQWNEFRSPQAKTLFRTYLQTEKQLEEQQSKLQELRTQYIRSSKAERARLAPAILDLEKHVEQLSTDIRRTATRVRNTEINSFK